MRIFAKSHELINENIQFIDRAVEQCLSSVLLESAKEFNNLKIEKLIIDTTKSIPNECLYYSDYVEKYYYLKNIGVSLVKITVYAK